MSAHDEPRTEATRTEERMAVECDFCCRPFIVRRGREEIARRLIQRGRALVHAHCREDKRIVDEILEAEWRKRHPDVL